MLMVGSRGGRNIETQYRGICQDQLQSPYSAFSNMKDQGLEKNLHVRYLKYRLSISLNALSRMYRDLGKLKMDLV